MASPDIQKLLDTQPVELPGHIARGKVGEDGKVYPTQAVLDREFDEDEWFRSNIVKTDQRIDSVKAVADGASAAVATETNARVSADEALAQQIVTATANLNDTINAQVQTEASARASADGALAEQIATVNAKAGNATANGQIYFAAIAAPAGAVAAYGIYLTAGNVFTGLALIAKSDGTSSIAFYANKMALIDSGTLQNVFNYIAGKFYFNVPVVVQTIDIAQQAVTVPSTASVSGTGSGDTAGGWVTLLTLTVNGGPGYALVLNTDYAYIATSGGGTGTITGSWRILKDGGNTLKSGGLGVYADYNPVFISLLDVNIPGTHTYQFQIYVQATNGKAFQFSNITFLADLRKR